jgi:hypothetical protein
MAQLTTCSPIQKETKSAKAQEAKQFGWINKKQAPILCINF